MRHSRRVILLLCLLEGLAMSSLAAQYTDVYCDWETIDGALKYSCVGIDRDRGGAITFLATDWLPSGNLIDNGIPDNGRQAQASIYYGGASYPGCWPCNSGCHWGWNPVQAGSCSTKSGYYHLEQTPSYLFTQTQPLHWDNELGRSSFYIGQVLRFLSYNTLEIEYQLWNDQTFSTGTASHELPVVYLEPFLSTAKSYIGSSPFTSGPVATISTPTNGAVDVVPTEKWVGWFEAGGRGIALYVPTTSYIQTWRMGRLPASSGAATSFMQNWALWNLQPDTPYSTRVYLILGTVEEIRAAVYAMEGF